MEFAKIKSAYHHIEWSGVMSLLGFGSLDVVITKEGYPFWFGTVLAAIGLFLVIVAAKNSHRQKSEELIDKYEEKFFERMKWERRVRLNFY
jgi:hypothetical protein